MNIRNCVSRALLLAAATLLAVSAQASPITYAFTSGQVTLTATVGGTPVAGPAVIVLNGNSVVLDQVANTLNSISLSAGASATIPISPAYSGYTSIHFDFLSLTASNGTVSLFDPGPPQGYDYTIGNVAVSGQFDATNTNSLLTLTNKPFSLPSQPASGQLFVDGGADIGLNGITLLSIDPDGPGGNPPLVVKGDFLFVGAVPEPGTALLFGLGLAGVASVRRRLA